MRSPKKDLARELVSLSQATVTEISRGRFTHDRHPNTFDGGLFCLPLSPAGLSLLNRVVGRALMFNDRVTDGKAVPRMRKAREL